jgi:hypothetical protein
VTHAHKFRRQYLLIGVLLSVLVTLGIRYHAGAAEPTPGPTSPTGASSEEFDGAVFEMSGDDLAGVTIESQQLRFEQSSKAAPPALDKAQLDALSGAIKTSIEEDYGWDMSTSIDRQGVLDEVRRLSEELHTIPDSTLKEHKGLADLRDLVDMLKGVSECRDRCLQPPSGGRFFQFVPLVAIGSAVTAIVASGASDNVFTALAAASTLAAYYVFYTLERVYDIDSRPLQKRVMGALFVTLSFINQNSHDARGLAKEQSRTPADGVKAEAKGISELTPATADAPKDYDMVHDEL